jgi:hypothetical protein
MEGMGLQNDSESIRIDLKRTNYNLNVCTEKQEIKGHYV